MVLLNNIKTYAFRIKNNKELSYGIIAQELETELEKF